MIVVTARAYILLNQKKYQMCIDQCSTLLSLKPFHAAAYHTRGLAFALSGCHVEVKSFLHSQFEN
jgi:hypothetical protein